jgi:hypothetical protein
MPDFVLDDAVAHALAAATPDPAGTATLRRARLNRTMLILLAIGRDHPERRAALRIIAEAQDADRGAVEAVLSHPWVAVWAARCLRPGGRRQLAYVDNVAAACLHRAGATRPGAVTRPTMLPAVGMLRPGLGLQPLRGLDLPYRLWVDDLDPYRDCHGLPAAPRLPDEKWLGWECDIRGAARLLRDHAPEWSDDLAAGLSTITPLNPGRARTGLSVTHGDAFGGFACTRPDRPADLAVTMVHEFQHSKLNALLDLVPLQRPDADATGPAYFAPWRPDPRPLSGMIQGTSAFLAVARVWHRFRAAPALEADATRRFATVRAQVARAAEQLPGAPGLTPAGQAYARDLAGAAAALLDLPVPSLIDDAARALVTRAESRLAR